VTRIHFAYRTVDSPWGGANNFLRALRGQLSQSNAFVFTPAIEDDCDILFMNQLGAGPGAGSKQYSLRMIRHLVGRSLVGSTRLPGKRKLVVRAVNLYSNVFGPGLRNLTLGRLRDWKAVALLNIADLVIFQSAYQRSLYLDAGYKGASDVIIHNGAEKTFWAPHPAHPPLERVLKLISSTASPRRQKRHDIIARLSSVDGVEVHHLGAWPDDVDPMRVRLLGMQTREQMVEALSACHYFVHAGIKDACPNVLFEAITAGLPVIYNPGTGSSREIVQDCGLPLDEAELDMTVLEARRRLPALRATVLAAREHFTIARAAAAYRRVFEETVRGIVSQSARSLR
jgi:glycosyltransferase involved in cell wall biosynthesis